MKPAEAEAAILLPKDYFDYASTTAIKMGVDPVKLTRTLACESKWNPNALGDNGHSRGLAQIHDRYHPDVTPAQAYDGIWAINWAAARFAEGRGSLWTCYRKYYGK